MDTNWIEQSKFCEKDVITLNNYIKSVHLDKLDRMDCKIVYGYIRKCKELLELNIEKFMNEAVLFELFDLIKLMKVTFRPILKIRGDEQFINHLSDKKVKYLLDKYYVTGRGLLFLPLCYISECHINSTHDSNKVFIYFCLAFNSVRSIILKTKRNSPPSPSLSPSTSTSSTLSTFDIKPVELYSYINHSTSSTTSAESTTTIPTTDIEPVAYSNNQHKSTGPKTTNPKTNRANTFIVLSTIIGSVICIYYGIRLSWTK